MVYFRPPPNIRKCTTCVVTCREAPLLLTYLFTNLKGCLCLLLAAVSMSQCAITAIGFNLPAQSPAALALALTLALAILVLFHFRVGGKTRDRFTYSPLRTKKKKKFCLVSALVYNNIVAHSTAIENKNKHT